MTTNGSGAGSRADGFDAVVLGSGQNGLVAALRMALAGRKVLLVEGQDRVGGSLRTEELTLPGFHHDVGATVVPLAVASPAFRELAPDVTWCHPPVPAGHALQGTHAGLLHRSVDETAAGLGRDGLAWRALVGSAAAAGDPLVDTLLAPFDGLPAAPLAAARYGATGVLPASVLGRVFRTPQGRGLFAGMAGHSELAFTQLVSGGYGVLLAALAHSVGWPLVQGGTGVLGEVLAARLRGLGGEIHTSTPISSLDELPPAAATFLDVSPQQLADLAGDQLPPGYRRRMERFRRGPGVFKLDWALDGPVPWRDESLAGAGTVHLGGTLEEIAAAENEVARGGHPERPYVLTVQASVADATRAPEGKHTFWAYCHVPNGSTLDQTRAIEDQVERHAPGFRERVLGRHVFSPAALQAWNPNLLGGDLGGGAQDLVQFLVRPTLSPTPWKTPLDGVYLCSSSTPPGGGVHGMGGWTAAGGVLAGRG